jgi:hypothetical protein
MTHSPPMTAVEAATSTPDPGGRLVPRRRHLTIVRPARLAPTLPPILLGGEAGAQDRLPGECWPALAVTQFQQPGRPVIAWWEIDEDEAVKFLIDWQHKLHINGEPYTRPFGTMFFRMDVLGRPAAIVSLASSPNEWVSKKHGLGRYDCVDLSRICRSPDRRDEFCLRAVLRLAREYLVPLYPMRYPRKWSVVKAACANSLPGTPSSKMGVKAGMYRFDGWERLRLARAKSGGGKRGKPSKATEIDDGLLGLWVYLYPDPELHSKPRLRLAA